MVGKVGSGAALVGACLTVFLLCTSFKSPWNGSQVETLQYTPHMGALTMMVESQKASILATKQGRTTDLAQMDGNRMQKSQHAADAAARAWAQQLMSTAGNSDAERRSRTAMPPLSLSTRRYSNTHPGYTSDIAETREDPEEGAYDFASRISDQKNEREMKAARYQQLSDVHVDREQQLPKSISTRGYSNTHAGYSSDVPETRDAPEDGAWDFASRISRQRDEREMARRSRKPAAREQQLSLVDESGDGQSLRQQQEQQDRTAWQWANENALREQDDTKRDDAQADQQDADQDASGDIDVNQARSNNRRQTRLYSSPSLTARTTAYSPSRRTPSGFTSAIPEMHDTAEGTAWDWAADQFAHRRRIHEPPAARRLPRRAEKAKSAGKQQQVQAPTEQQVREDIRLIRAMKIAAARQAMGDLHTSTQHSEDIDFARKVKQEALRVRQIQEKAESEERAANEGADEENQEYANIAASGLPNGAESAEAVLGAGLGALATSATGSTATTNTVAPAGDKIKPTAASEGVLEAAVFHAGYEAGLKTAEAEEQEKAAARLLKKENAAKVQEEKMLAQEKALVTKQQQLKDNAREQELAATNGDADGTFQVDRSSTWGPSSGDWA